MGTSLLVFLYGICGIKPLPIRIYGLLPVGNDPDKTRGKITGLPDKPFSFFFDTWTAFDTCLNLDKYVLGDVLLCPEKLRSPVLDQLAQQ